MSDLDWEKLYWEREKENENLRERLSQLELDYENSRRAYRMMQSAYESFTEQRRTWEGKVEELEREVERLNEKNNQLIQT